MQRVDLQELAGQIRTWGRELGFQQVGIADTAIPEAQARLAGWLAGQMHGEMAWMARHGAKRTRPAELVPGTRRVICVRMDYLTGEHGDAGAIGPTRAAVARYARGRDYHKVMRRRLQKLADRITATVGKHGYRVFVDSGPVMEKPLAQKAGLGWIGKHTNLINRDSGSWFFLGEIYTDLPLPADVPATDHCGTCSACMAVCPTGAIVAPYVLDARRCIAYLTIENRGPIAPELRPGIGNRIFGCDDCQAVCPWNKFARPTDEGDFQPRHGLDEADLTALFAWTEDEWERRTEGSALRRAGYPGWLRNIAVALGNAPRSPEVVDALRARSGHPSALVREHVEWALARHAARDALSTDGGQAG